MDPIELMAIKPWQIKQALGKDRVKVIRGSRQVYNERQSRIRRGWDKESDDDQSLEIEPIWKCTDVACCGGIIKRRIRVKLVMQDNVCQTDRMDMVHYWDTKEELRKHNVTILTGRPRDIQDGVVRGGGSQGSNNIIILQSGSTTSVGSQVNLEPNRSKIANFFSKKFQSMKKAWTELFNSAPLSPDDTTDDEEIPAHEPEERDHEWLEITESELSQDDLQIAFDKEFREHPPPARRIELQCHNLSSAIGPFFWLLKLGGRWPFETRIEDRLLKYRLNIWSRNFIIFVLTTLYLITCTSQGTASIITLVSTTNNTHTYEAAREKFLFDKYWPFAFTTFLCAAYACIWSLAIMFDDGRLVADFMSRWNLGVVAINANPCESFRTQMWLSLGWLIFYFGLLIFLFIWDSVPGVQGTSDLLGSLMLRPILSESSLAEYHAAVRMFGFVFHLYAVYAARAVTLLIVLYCKFLENLARRWNLRFCYVCGMLGRFEPPNRYITYHTVIPYTKLFTEHKLILAFSRHTGQIFSIALYAYFVEKSLEMMVLSYGVCVLFMFVDEDAPQYNNGAVKNLTCPAGLPNCKTIYYKDADVFVVLTLLYCVAQSFAGWYATSDSIAACGQAIMSGFNFVRRYGLPRCKTSKERRFIESLTFVFAPLADYYVSPGLFVINRRFIYEMFAWVFALTTMVIAFSPFQLAVEEMTVCHALNNGSLNCYSETMYKKDVGAWIERIVEERPQVIVFRGKPTAAPYVNESTTLSPSAGTTTKSPLSVTHYHKCNRGSASSIPSKTIYVPFACSSNSDYHEVIVAFSPKVGRGCYDKLHHSTLTQPYPATTTTGDLYNCFTSASWKLDLSLRDDCGNLAFISPDGSIPPKTYVDVLVEDGAGIRQCCCYDYFFYSKVGIKVKENECGMSDVEQATNFCTCKGGPC